MLLMMRCALVGITFLVGSAIHLAFSTQYDPKMTEPNNELALTSELRLIMCEYCIGIAGYSCMYIRGVSFPYTP